MPALLKKRTFRTLSEKTISFVKKLRKIRKMQKFAGIPVHST